MHRMNAVGRNYLPVFRSQCRYSDPSLWMNPRNDKTDDPRDGGFFRNSGEL